MQRPVIGDTEVLPRRQAVPGEPVVKRLGLADGAAQGSFEQADVQRAADLYIESDLVGRVIRVQLLGVPQASCPAVSSLLSCPGPTKVATPITWSGSLVR
jgi:hypothetical protein